MLLYVLIGVSGIIGIAIVALVVQRLRRSSATNAPPTERSTLLADGEVKETSAGPVYTGL